MEGSRCAEGMGAQSAWQAGFSACRASEDDQLVGPFSLELHIFNVFFLACFPLDTIPWKYLHKGEKQGVLLLEKGLGKAGCAVAPQHLH